MAYHGGLTYLPGLQAAADLSSYQFRFVYLSAANKVTYCGTAGAAAIGVLCNKPAAAGRAADVTDRGIAKVEAGAAVAAGAAVMTDASGRAITATNANAKVLGYAVNAASGAGSIIEVVLQIDSTSTSAGFIPLSLSSMREIASDDIQNLAAHGGILASDSEPKLARVNGATDKALRVIWAATAEAQFAPVAMPPDLDASSNVTIHLLMAMAGATDTPTVDVQVFDAVGDTEMGGATAAVTGTSVAEYSVTISAANVSGHPTGFLNISLVPGAHTTDLLYLYGAWVEYTKA